MAPCLLLTLFKNRPILWDFSSFEHDRHERVCCYNFSDNGDANHSLQGSLWAIIKDAHHVTPPTQQTKRLKQYIRKMTWNKGKNKAYRPEREHKISTSNVQNLATNYKYNRSRSTTPFSETIFKETDQKTTKTCTDDQAPKHQIILSHQNQHPCVNKQRILLKRKT